MSTIDAPRAMPRLNFLVRWVAVMGFIAMTSLTGCATLPDGTRWGENAGFRVGWDRVADAVEHAARSPAVWAPLAGAAVMQIDNWDHRVSSWAMDNTPVFGSGANAHNWSDDLEVAAGAAYLTSLLATPSGDDATQWWSAKLKGGMVGLGAVAAESITTEGLKNLTSRERPNGTNGSFPSSHTSFAAVADSMTVRNLQSIPMSGAMRTALVIGADTLTFATGWARVEAGAHYPSDVLVGMSIGNFFSRMFDDAFLGDDLSRRLAVAFEPVRGGGELVWSWQF